MDLDKSVNYAIGAFRYLTIGLSIPKLIPSNDMLLARYLKLRCAKVSRFESFRDLVS